MSDRATTNDRVADGDPISALIADLRSKLTRHETCYLKVKVLSRMPTTEIAEILEDSTLKVRVAAIPEKGKANAELLKFLKKTTGAKHADILSGKTDRIKLVRLALVR
jgi:uncharacterized protein (TIGR00251 family)